MRSTILRSHLLGRTAHGMSDLVVGLGVVHLRLKQQCFRIKLLRQSNLRLGAERGPMSEFLLHDATGFGARRQQFLGYFQHLLGPLELVVCSLHGETRRRRSLVQGFPSPLTAELHARATPGACGQRRTSRSRNVRQSCRSCAPGTGHCPSSCSVRRHQHRGRQYLPSPDCPGNIREVQNLIERAMILPPAPSCECLSATFIIAHQRAAH